MVGTYYCFYSTVSKVEIAAGNVLAGTALDAGRNSGAHSLPWWGLMTLGAACAVSSTTARPQRQDEHSPPPSPPRRDPPDPPVAGSSY
ncbi:hypothetical protein ABZT47_18110 [Sphaerisporangium sp. NPDC005289]|uniref:hypothetical protein n=1 Tax=Sphaerisporangium sp. NPDC005289 TaxID=3155247 RepID=UPI0033AFA127